MRHGQLDERGGGEGKEKEKITGQDGKKYKLNPIGLSIHSMQLVIVLR